jgi:hypothetical protein
VRPFWLAGAFLMMMDGLTTYLALTMSGDGYGAREGNPVMAHLVEVIGLAGMCVVKGMIGVCMVWRLAAIADHGHRWEWMNRGLLFRPRPLWKVQRSATWALAFTLVLMGVVVGNNLRAVLTLAST